MPQIDQLEISAKIDAILNRWPAVGLAVGVVRDGALEFAAHGVANIESAIPVTENTVFRIGSITKTFTAVAVMQLWEQGLIDLDAPANDYLRAFRLLPAKEGWRPATTRHLLTHTAGVPEWLHPLRMINSGWFAETFPLDQRVPTLAQYYQGGLRLAAEPGTIWTYTDHGFATLGQIVEDVSRQPLDRYFRDRIFEPLGMTDTDLLRSPRLAVRLATGYRIRSDGAKAVIDRQGVTPAAGSIYSTPLDMARYIAALLAGGAGEHGSILRPDTVALMFQPHYQPDPRIPGYGPRVLASKPQRSCCGGAPGGRSGVQFTNLPGARRWRRRHGVHERVQERSELAQRGDGTAAPRTDRHPAGGYPQRRSAAPRHLGRALRSVPAPCPANRHAGVEHPRRRS